MPALRGPLIKEDQFLENLTALLSLISFSYVLFLIVRFRRVFLISFVVFLLSLVFFLDETSFGSRFFHFSTPVLWGTSIDGAHDLVELGFKFLETHNLKALLVMTPLALLVFLCLVFLLWRKQGKLDALFSLGERNHRAEAFVVGSLLFIGFSLSMELLFEHGGPLDPWVKAGTPLFGMKLLITHRMLVFAEELAEFNAALTLLFAALALRHPPSLSLNR